MTVYVDGVSVGSVSGSTTDVVTNAAVYVGSPTIAKVTLSDITLSESRCRHLRKYCATTTTTTVPCATPAVPVEGLTFTVVRT